MQFAEGKQFVFGLFAATIALGSLQPPLLPGCAHRAHALSFCYLCTVFEEHSDLGAQCFTGQQLEGLRGSSTQCGQQWQWIQVWWSSWKHRGWVQ